MSLEDETQQPPVSARPVLAPSTSTSNSHFPLTSAAPPYLPAHPEPLAFSDPGSPIKWTLSPEKPLGDTIDHRDGDTPDELGGVSDGTQVTSERDQSRSPSSSISPIESNDEMDVDAEPINQSGESSFPTPPDSGGSHTPPHPESKRDSPLRPLSSHKPPPFPLLASRPLISPSRHATHFSPSRAAFSLAKPDPEPVTNNETQSSGSDSLTRGMEPPLPPIKRLDALFRASAAQSLGVDESLPQETVTSLTRSEIAWATQQTQKRSEFPPSSPPASQGAFWGEPTFLNHSNPPTHSDPPPSETQPQSPSQSIPEPTYISSPPERFANLARPSPSDHPRPPSDLFSSDARFDPFPSTQNSDEHALFVPTQMIESIPKPPVRPQPIAKPVLPPHRMLQRRDRGVDAANAPLATRSAPVLFESTFVDGGRDGVPGPSRVPQSPLLSESIRDSGVAPGPSAHLEDPSQLPPVNHAQSSPAQSPSFLPAPAAHRSPSPDSQVIYGVLGKRNRRRITSEDLSHSSDSSPAPEDPDDETFRPNPKAKAKAPRPVSIASSRLSSPEPEDPEDHTSRARNRRKRSKRTSVSSAVASSYKAASPPPDPTSLRVFSLWAQIDAYCVGSITRRSGRTYRIDFDDGMFKVQGIDRCRLLRLRKGEQVETTRASGYTVAADWAGEGPVSVVDRRGVRSQLATKDLCVSKKFVDSYFNDRRVVDSMLSFLDPHSVTPTILTSLSGKVFLTSGTFGEKVKQAITRQGSTVETRWDALFESNSVPRFKSGPPVFLLVGGVVTMTAKVMVALAMGIPILAAQYVEDAAVENVDWRAYLVGIEASSLGQAVSQLVDPKWGEADWDVLAARAVRRPFEGKSVLFLRPASEKTSEIQVIAPFCLKGLGATVMTSYQVPTDVGNHDYVLYDDREKGKGSIGGMVKTGLEKRCNVQWFKQCLIRGKALAPALLQD